MRCTYDIGALSWRRYVSSKVRAAGLLDLYGAQGSTNVQGEEVKKLDVVANDAFITSLKRSHKVRVAHAWRT